MVSMFGNHSLKARSIFSGDVQWFCKAQPIRIHAGTSGRRTYRFENRLRSAAKSYGSHRAKTTKDYSIHTAPACGPWIQRQNISEWEVP